MGLCSTQESLRTFLFSLDQNAVSWSDGTRDGLDELRSFSTPAATFEATPNA